MVAFDFIKSNQALYYTKKNLLNTKGSFKKVCHYFWKKNLFLTKIENSGPD